MRQTFRQPYLFMTLALAALLGLSACSQEQQVGTPDPDGQLTALSHFRSIQLTWTQVSGNTVQFKSAFGLRRSAYGSPTIGSTISESISYGDGTSQWIAHTVTHVDVANDWIIAEATFNKTYAGSGPYIASFYNCCRLSAPQHRNNPDGYNRIETLVNLATTASPISSISPIVDCPKNAACSFTVPASHPAGGLRYRFATSNEAAGGSSFSQPPGAAINSATGVYTWNTTGASLNPSGDSYYSTQVVIEKLDGGNVVSKTAVDFFIRLSDQASTNKAPEFHDPTPEDGAVIDATVGSTVTFDVEAHDHDAGDTVTLGMFNKPASATFTTTVGNTATGNFSWTPSATGTTLLTLTAQDQKGLGATQRSITINVTQTSDNTPPETDISSSPTALNNKANASFAFSGTDDVTPAGDLTFECSLDGAAFSSCSSPSAYTSLADGSHTFNVRAIDAAGNVDPTPASYTWVVDATAPKLSPTVSPNPILLNGSATASPNADDGSGSGIASSSCDAVDTNSVGAKTVNCTATDKAGNTATATASYSVNYNFIGFAAPVDKPNTMNVSKAGQTIPLKWRLLDANNQPVSTLTSVTLPISTLSCGASASEDPVTEVASGSTGLQNLGDGYYQFNWKTPTTYANSCRQVGLNLGEGTPRTGLAWFNFKK